MAMPATSADEICGHVSIERVIVSFCARRVSSIPPAIQITATSLPDLLVAIQSLTACSWQVAAPLIGSIPLASLAGVMLCVGLSTLQPEATLACAKEALTFKSWSSVVELVALVSTGLMCYFVDMASGIGLGVMVTISGEALVSRLEATPSKEQEP